MRKIDGRRKTVLKIVTGMMVVMIMLNAMRIEGIADSETTVILSVSVVIGVSVGLFIAGAKKAGSKKEESEHSHDRLQSSNTAQLCDDDTYTHWKKQLDDFLEAGIIERAEYTALLSRYKSEK